MVLVAFLVAVAALYTTSKVVLYIRSRGRITALDLLGAPIVITLGAIFFPITCMLIVLERLIKLMVWLENTTVWRR